MSGMVEEYGLVVDKEYFRSGLNNPYIQRNETTTEPKLVLRRKLPFGKNDYVLQLSGYKPKENAEPFVLFENIKKGDIFKKVWEYIDANLEKEEATGEPAERQWKYITPNEVANNQYIFKNQTIKFNGLERTIDITVRKDSDGCNPVRVIHSAIFKRGMVGCFIKLDVVSDNRTANCTYSVSTNVKNRHTHPNIDVNGFICGIENAIIESTNPEEVLLKTVAYLQGAWRYESGYNTCRNCHVLNRYPCPSCCYSRRPDGCDTCPSKNKCTDQQKAKRVCSGCVANNKMYLSKYNICLLENNQANENCGMARCEDEWSCPCPTAFYVMYHSGLRGSCEWIKSGTEGTNLLRFINILTNLWASPPCPDADCSKNHICKSIDYMGLNIPFTGCGKDKNKCFDISFYAIRYKQHPYISFLTMIKDIRRFDPNVDANRRGIWSDGRNLIFVGFEEG